MHTLTGNDAATLILNVRQQPVAQTAAARRAFFFVAKCQ